jgi:RNA polymerase sigma-70 factor (ECF subfamily)
LLTAQEYKQWLAVAARHARRKGEAQDLLHDSLLAAAEARRTDLSTPQSRAWFAGLIRNKALMDARTAGRRRRREASVARAQRPALSTPADDADLKLVRSLPPAARAVATLALHGMTRAEIAFALGLSNVALRQRLTTLRRKWAGLSDEVRQTAIEQAARRQRTIGTELELGVIRRALVSLVREVEGIGTHDPDGHLIVFEHGAESRFRARRQQ